MTQADHMALSVPQPDAELFQPDDFAKAACALLTGTQQGHMEQWEYGAPQYHGDRAGGLCFWAEFIKSPRSYYVTEADKLMIEAVTGRRAPSVLRNIRTVIELGPGCNVSVSEKTIPFIESCSNLDAYIAVDSEISHAQAALEYIRSRTNVRRLEALHQDFNKGSLNFPRLGPTALIMWGCTFGNIAGRIGTDPYPGLVRKLAHYHSMIASGDYLFVSFDSQDKEEEILNAYNQPLLSSCLLSPLHRLTRDGLVTGDFDPNQWRHESLWIPETMQCAHTIYPVVDQNFVMNGLKIFIPRGKRLVTNNSYKFKPGMIFRAAKEVGFIPQIVEHAPIGMLVAEKV